jgi:hypothetical protein
MGHGPLKTNEKETYDSGRIDVWAVLFILNFKQKSFMRNLSMF